LCNILDGLLRVFMASIESFECIIMAVVLYKKIILFQLLNKPIISAVYCTICYDFWSSLDNNLHLEVLLTHYDINLIQFAKLLIYMFFAIFLYYSPLH